MRRYTVKVGPETRAVGVGPEGQGHRVTLDGEDRILAVDVDPATGVLHWLDGTRVVNAHLDPVGDKLTITVRGHSTPVVVEDAAVEAVADVKGSRGPTGPAEIRAPMSGRLLKATVQSGTAVKAGTTLFVIEAMKMENEIQAPRDGSVRKLEVAEGVAVEVGQILAVLE